MKRKFEVFIPEEAIIPLYKKAQEVIPYGRWHTISIGNCGWVSDPDMWFFRVRVNEDEARKLRRWMKTELYEERRLTS